MVVTSFYLASIVEYERLMIDCNCLTISISLYGQRLKTVTGNDGQGMADLLWSVIYRQHVQGISMRLSPPTTLEFETSTFPQLLLFLIVELVAADSI
jgi:hypothetical protein